MSYVETLQNLVLPLQNVTKRGGSVIDLIWHFKSKTGRLPSNEQARLINELWMGLQAVYRQIDRYRHALRVFDSFEASLAATETQINTLLPQVRDFDNPERDRVKGLFETSRAELAEILLCQEVALRDSANSIYHLVSGLAVIVNRARALPDLFDPADDGLKDPARLTNQSFPDWNAVRNGISHSVQLELGVNKYQDQRIDGSLETPNITIENSKDVIITERQGRQLIVTWNGKPNTHELSAEKYADLQAVRLALSSIYEPKPPSNW